MVFLGSFVDKPPDAVAGDENCSTDRQELFAIFVTVLVEWLTWDSLAILASLLLCSYPYHHVYLIFHFPPKFLLLPYLFFFS